MLRALDARVRARPVLRAVEHLRQRAIQDVVHQR
jgi:hypothetical protein